MAYAIPLPHQRKDNKDYEAYEDEPFISVEREIAKRYSKTHADYAPEEPEDKDKK